MFACFSSGKTRYGRSALLFEPPHDKTNKVACAPIKDSDQPGHPTSLIRVFTVHIEKHWVLSYPLSASEDSDQTGQMPRLTRVFDGRTLIFCWLCHESAHFIPPLPHPPPPPRYKNPCIGRTRTKIFNTDKFSNAASPICTIKIFLHV